VINLEYDEDNSSRWADAFESIEEVFCEIAQEFNMDVSEVKEIYFNEGGEDE
jgi:hypothetical protein